MDKRVLRCVVTAALLVIATLTVLPENEKAEALSHETEIEMKPSEIPTWATDVGATNDPGATRKATGFVTGKKAPAKWFNWLFNRVGQWAQYVNNLHNEPEFLNKPYAWTGAHGFSDAVGLYGQPMVGGTDNEILYGDDAGVVTPRLRTIVLDGAELQWLPRVQGAAGSQTGIPIEQYARWGKLPLRLPNGSTLVRVRVGYERKAAGDDADLYIRRTTYTKAPPFPEYPAVEIWDTMTSGTGQQVIDLGPLTEPPIDTSTTTYVLEISPSGDRTQPLPDIVHWIEYQFLDPGPRNF